MLRSIGPAELLIILTIVMVLFGASRVGDIGKSLGQGIREFRRELNRSEDGPTTAGAVKSDSRSDSEPPRAETSEEKKSFSQQH